MTKRNRTRLTKLEQIALNQQFRRGYVDPKVFKRMLKAKTKRRKPAWVWRK